MEKEAFRLILTSEAEYFIANLPEAAAEKVRYNIHRVMLGERNNELFKKLENTDIWEFRTLTIERHTDYSLFGTTTKIHW